MLRGCFLRWLERAQLLSWMHAWAWKHFGASGGANVPIELCSLEAAQRGPGSGAQEAVAIEVTRPSIGQRPWNREAQEA